MNHPEIRYISNKDIDYQKWDLCIGSSPWSMVYAKSWYLDLMCDHWDALVWGDYLYVMPLVYRRKYGISYICQPYFVQQLGVFSPFQVDSEMINLFLKNIPVKFRLIDMKLNCGNYPTIESFRLVANKNYRLNLQDSYQFIQENYSENTRRNIRKANKNKIQISLVYDHSKFIEFTHLNLKNKTSGMKTSHFQPLLKLINFATSRQTGEIYGAFDETNTMVAAAFFITDQQKSIYLAASSCEIGSSQRAMFLIVDSYIRNHIGKLDELDFEGSNIEGVARFYDGFGASPFTYYSAHLNRLPLFMRFLKK